MAFTGEQLDGLSGLYHLRARQYNPAVGQFLSMDPVAPARTDPYVGTYVYAENNPTLLIDPAGTYNERKIGGGAGGGGGGIAGGGTRPAPNWLDIGRSGRFRVTNRAYDHASFDRHLRPQGITNQRGLEDRIYLDLLRRPIPALNQWYEGYVNWQGRLIGYNYYRWADTAINIGTYFVMRGGGLQP